MTKTDSNAAPDRIALGGGYHLLGDCDGIWSVVDSNGDYMLDEDDARAFAAAMQLAALSPPAPAAAPAPAEIEGLVDAALMAADKVGTDRVYGEPDPALWDTRDAARKTLLDAIARLSAPPAPAGEATVTDAMVALRAAATSFVRGYSISNWSDLPDNAVSGAQVTHGQLRALATALRAASALNPKPEEVGR